MTSSLRFRHLLKNVHTHEAILRPGCHSSAIPSEGQSVHRAEVALVGDTICLQLTRQLLCPQTEEQRPKLLSGTAATSHVSDVLAARRNDAHFLRPIVDRTNSSGARQWSKGHCIEWPVCLRFVQKLPFHTFSDVPYAHAHIVRNSGNQLTIVIEVKLGDARIMRLEALDFGSGICSPENQFTAIMRTCNEVVCSPPSDLIGR
mmetsp:Transcript_40581/g.87908  ORF Transcript_40581/g.87908 Transcript_40581/m.87908 type:complete len:203 (-) Transcript_40581:963-1571(-)